MPTYLQGGLTNEQLRQKWREKLPGVKPKDNELSAFALGVEVGVSLNCQAPQVVIDTIHGVENRCMAADGPVTLTSDEITEAELKRMYDAAVAALARAGA